MVHQRCHKTNPEVLHLYPCWVPRQDTLGLFVYSDLRLCDSLPCFFFFFPSSTVSFLAFCFLCEVMCDCSVVQGYTNKMIFSNSVGVFFLLKDYTSLKFQSLFWLILQAHITHQHSPDGLKGACLAPGTPTPAGVTWSQQGSVTTHSLCWWWSRLAASPPPEAFPQC